MRKALKDAWIAPASGTVLRWLALIVGVASIFVAGGFWYYRAQTQREREKAFQTLKAVADLKVMQILAWRADRRADARVVALSPSFARAVRDLISHPEDQALGMEIRRYLALMASYKGYANLMVAGPDGSLKLSLDSRLTELDGQEKATGLRAIATDEVSMGELYAQLSSGDIRLDTAAPIESEDGTAIGMLILRDDPSKSLYPLVESWPTEAKTAETMLVRRAGQTALVINELRFKKGTALTLGYPLTDVQRLAVQAILGKRGLTEGLNYRGKEVVADIVPMADSGWIMIAMEDRDEVTGEIRSRGMLIGLVAALLACVTGTSVGLIVLRRRRNVYRRLFHAQLDRAEVLNLFRTTVYSIGEGVITADIAGRVKHLNRMAEALTGWSEEAARGRPIGEVFRIVNEVTRARVDDPVRRVLSEGSVVEIANHTLLIARDGSERPIADSGAPIRSQEGGIIGVVLVFRDQTEQRFVDQKIRESEARYRTLFESMQEGVALHRLISGGNGQAADYEIVDINPAFARQTGIHAEKAKGARASFLYGPAAPPYLEDYEKVARGGAPILFETYFAPLGRHFLISVFSPEAGWFATVFSDVTDRKRAEFELEAEKERLRVTLGSIGDGVIATDVQGKVMLMNKVAETLTGWDAKGAVGKTAAEIFCIVNAATRNRCEDPVEKVLKSGNVMGLANHTILVAHDGREYAIAGSGSPIRDRAGKIVGVVLVYRDETLKEKLDEELLKAEKLEALSVLAGGIAHDFNNILTGIMGNISLAAAELEGGTPVFEWIEEAQRASIRAKELVRQLLTFAKGGTPIKKLCDVENVIRDTARFACHGSTSSCKYAFASDLWPTEVDEGQLGQVIQNIVINSVQAMPTGGIITLTAENVIFAMDNRFLLAAGPYLRISIADTGVGIHETMIPRIFDPFFTTKKGGSGLGLATCYSIVRNHQGCIDVSSEPGAGSRFDIYLPAAIGRPLPQKVGRLVEISPRGRKVLVMDDEEPLRRLAKAMLVSLGFDAEAAPEGGTAVELYRDAKQAGRPFDAVILDLTVAGGMGGKEASDFLRRLDPSVRIIVSSGYSNDAIVSNHRENGFRGVLIKPYGLDDLKSVLVEVLGG